ncbi:hypothetical protein L6R29_21285 [Myxococcota bacterium]|nr:hypothetical protein [Myxococcota bacterium]
MTQQPPLSAEIDLASLESHARWAHLLSHIPVLLQSIHRHGLQNPESWAEIIQTLIPHSLAAMLYPHHIALWTYRPHPTHQTLPLSLPSQDVFASIQTLSHSQLPQPLQQALTKITHPFPSDILCVPISLLHQRIGTLLWWFSTPPSPQQQHAAVLLSEQLSPHLALAPLLSSPSDEPLLQTFLRSETLRETTPSIRQLSTTSEPLLAPPSTSHNPLPNEQHHPRTKTTHTQKPLHAPLPPTEKETHAIDNLFPNSDDLFFPNDDDILFPNDLEPTLPAAQPADLSPTPTTPTSAEENQRLRSALDEALRTVSRLQSTLHQATQLGEAQRQQLVELARLSLEMHEQIRELQTQRRLQTPEPFTQLNQAITQLLPKLQRSLAQLEEHYQHLAETHPQESHATYQLTSTSRALLNYLAQWSDYNRCLLGQIQPKIAAFSITSLLEQLKRSFRPQLEHKAIVWRWELHPPSLPALEGDEEIVSSLLSLIVGYAIDQCPLQGRIQLTLQSDQTAPPSSLQMRFEYPHVFLENADLQRLLEPFEEQAQPVFVPRLSLALAKQLSRLHQGHLALQYKDKHLVVLLRLPIQLPKRAKDDPRPALGVTRELPLLPSFPKQWRLPFAEQLQHLSPPYTDSPPLPTDSPHLSAAPSVEIKHPHPAAHSAEMQRHHSSAETQQPLPAAPSAETQQPLPAAPSAETHPPHPAAPSAEISSALRKASASVQTAPTQTTQRSSHAPSFDTLPPSSSARSASPLHSPYAPSTKLHASDLFTDTSRHSPYSPSAKPHASGLSADTSEPEIEFIELTPTHAPHDLAIAPPIHPPYGSNPSSTFGQLDTLAKQFPLYPMQGPSLPVSEDKHASRTLSAHPKPTPTALVYGTASGAGEEPQLLDGFQFLQLENHLFPTLEELAHQAQFRPPRLILFGPDDQQAPQLKTLRTRIEDNVRIHVPMLEKQGSIDFYRFHWSHYRSLPFSATHLLQWLQSVRIARPRQEKQLLVTGPSTLWGETAPLLQFLCGPRYRIHLEANPHTCAKTLHRNPPDLLLAQIDQNDPAWQEFFQELQQAIHLPTPPLLIFALTQLSQELNLLLQPFQQLLFLPA